MKTTMRMTLVAVMFEPGPPRPGVDRDDYRLKDDVFLTRAMKGFDAIHLNRGAGFDPQRGLAEFEHLYVRKSA